VREVWQRVLNQTMQALQVETVAIGLIEGPEQTLSFALPPDKMPAIFSTGIFPVGGGLPVR